MYLLFKSIPLMMMMMMIIIIIIIIIIVIIIIIIIIIIILLLSTFFRRLSAYSQTIHSFFLSLMYIFLFRKYMLLKTALK